MKGRVFVQNLVNSKNSSIKFQEIIVKIFESYDFKIGPGYLSLLMETEMNSDFSFDLQVEKADKSYIIETKFSRTSKFPASTLLESAERLSKCVPTKVQKAVPILVVGAMVQDPLRKKIQEYGLIVIDICNLLFLVEQNDELRNELVTFLDYSVADFVPQKPLRDIFGIPNAKEFFPEDKRTRSKSEELIDELKRWHTNARNARQRSSDYEKLCIKVLKYLFDDELALWHSQQRSESDLYRYDLICRIKDGPVSGLWTTILQCFNSKYVVFEFKNYTDKITQKEIYTTEKYLYLKALRGVAIIISCEGESTNALKAIKGTLRENGKLILSICNRDLIEMIHIKQGGGIPANYLYSIFDNLLIELEK